MGSAECIGVGCADLVRRTRSWTYQLHHFENHLTHKLCVWGKDVWGQLTWTENREFLDRFFGDLNIHFKNGIKRQNV